MTTRQRCGIGARCAALLAVMAALAIAVAAPAAADDSTSVTIARANPQPIVLQYFRAHDQRGLNVFETPKVEGVPYTGFQLAWGAAFTQQYQGLQHHNTAAVRMVSGVNANQLIDIGNGYNNAVANLYMDAQLARGIRVEMTSYLSSRHHNETWVKDGYLLIDGSPYAVPLLDSLMRHLTLRIGHFEINYGDAHFRRSDNGNAMFNPLVGNLIMDAFTTEIGTEAYWRCRDMMAMVGATGGEVRGQVTKPGQRAASYLGKLGFDRTMNPNLRVRLTGSMYTTAKSVNNTLYSGSRSGSRYYDVLENTVSTEAANAWSGDIQPGFRSRVQAFVVNPFLRCGSLELFGNVEQARGRAANETTDRVWHQNAGELVYRFAADQLYLAGRYNVASGRLVGIPNTVSTDRVQAGAGWFITPNLMAKAEWVQQRYYDFPASDIRAGGGFNGVMVEGIVAF